MHLGKREGSDTGASIGNTYLKSCSSLPKCFSSIEKSSCPLLGTFLGTNFSKLLLLSSLQKCRSGWLVPNWDRFYLISTLASVSKPYPHIKQKWNIHKEKLPKRTCLSQIITSSVRFTIYYCSRRVYYLGTKFYKWTLAN